MQASEGLCLACLVFSKNLWIKFKKQETLLEVSVSTVCLEMGRSRFAAVIR